MAAVERRRRRRRHDDHENHEAWAIPYGDLVTLLLAFFVVMYAMSSVNEGKYRILSDSLNEAFHGTPQRPQTLEPGAAHLTPVEQLPKTQVSRMIDGALPVHRVIQTAAAAPVTPSTVSAVPMPASAGPIPNHAASNAATSGELNQVADDVSNAMAALIASGEVKVRRYDNFIAVDISSDILFSSGVARLSSPAVTALKHLAEALKPWPNAIRVEGHTDDRPIATTAFPSNWELSSARAASVVHLFMDTGIAPTRLSVSGFGEYRPSMPNSSVAGRSANRRVDVIILGRDNGP